MGACLVFARRAGLTALAHTHPPVSCSDVPLALRAAQLEGIVPTINKFYGVHISFFETDSRLRQSNFFSAKIVDGGAVVTGAGSSGVAPEIQLMETYSFPTGLTNWVSYRIELDKPDNYDPACFLKFNDFRFVPSPLITTTTEITEQPNTDAH